MGNCDYRRYNSRLIDLVHWDAIDPVKILTKVEPKQSAIDAYEAFDKRVPGWIEVGLKPQATA